MVPLIRNPRTHYSLFTFGRGSDNVTLISFDFFTPAPDVNRGCQAPAPDGFISSVTSKKSWRPKAARSLSAPACNRLRRSEKREARSAERREEVLVLEPQSPELEAYFLRQRFRPAKDSTRVHSSRLESRAWGTGMGHCAGMGLRSGDLW